jgi:hypothetical protein
MIYYHTTDAADAILRDGFRDATGSYMLGGFELTGVFLGDSPMDVNEGAKGDQVLQIKFRDPIDVDAYELVEEGKTYREWCVPAALINDHAEVTLLTDDVLEAERLLDALRDSMAPPFPQWGDFTILKVRVTAVDEHGYYELAVLRGDDEDGYYEPARCNINDPEGERQGFHQQVDSLYSEWHQGRDGWWGHWWNGRRSLRRRGWKIREMMQERLTRAAQE